MATGVSLASGFWTAFTFSGALLSIALAVAQLTAKKKNVKHFALAFALVAAFILLLMSWLVQTGLGSDWPGIALYIPAMFLFGPCLFIFFQAVFLENFILERWYALLFVPAASALVFVIVDYAITGPTLLELFTTMKQPVIGLGKALMIGATGLNLSLYIYFTFRTVTIFRWKKLIGDTHSRLLLMSFLTTVAITSTVLVALIQSDLNLLNHCAMAIGAAVFAGLIMYFRYPDFFIEIKDIVQNEKSRRSLLAGTDIGGIDRHLHKLMDEDKLYTHEDLTLAELAGAVGLNSHQMSEYLNQHLGKSFAVFINENRIEAAQKLLREQPDASIISIAYRVGFQSKSTFNVAFQRLTGTTPTEYRRTSAGLGRDLS